MYSPIRSVLPESGPLRRAFAAVIALALALLSVSVIAITSASADGLPPDAGTPATVTADVLPTVQVNGVVWSQVTVGNTVYATGSFTQAWPAGVAQGGSGTVAVGNLIAYDITTGNRITTFNHSLDAQGLAIAASPDGSRVYVGGDFLNVDGVAHSHLAAFDTATGSLVSAFAPSVSSSVEAITATNSGVYFGGAFFNVNGRTRTRLAAVASTDGSLLSWAPTADDNEVKAMVLTPDRSRVIVGGKFSTLNGTAVNGMGSISLSDATLLPWAINNTVKDFGDKCGILSLSADGSQIYGTGYAFGCGNFEGTFAADPNTGNVVWVNDCHGDSYGTYATGQVLYSVSHAHDCSAIGAFPDTNPRTWHRALAFTTYAGGMNVGPDSYGWNYTGTPDATLLNWWPSLAPGTFTKQDQAAWSVTGNGNYVALGGEFPTVNSVAQSGLVRFAVHSIAPKKAGAIIQTSTYPVGVSLSAGTARVTWQSTYDRDNVRLTYSLLRDGGTTPIYTATQDSNFWQLPAMGFTDTGLTPGSSHTYKLRVTDPDGNKWTTPDSSPVTVASAPALSGYVSDVVADGASDLWRFSEPSGSTAYDWAGYNDLTQLAGVTEGAAGPISGDGATAATFSGSSAGTSGTQRSLTSPNTFSAEAWFKTGTIRGGKIIGFGSTQTGASASFDRHVYMDNSGRLIFGVYNGSANTIASSSGYNDNQYHHVVASLSSAGMSLYLDGKLVARNQTVKSGNPYLGYWRVGGDSLSGWSSTPSSNFFSGVIADAAIYPSALTQAQVQKHYTDSGRTLNIPAAPTDNYGKAVYGDSPDLFYRLNETSGQTATDSGRNAANGSYSLFGTNKGVSGAFAGSQTAVSFNGSQGALASPQFANPQVYSTELWFKTNTNNGGRLIGFGSSQTGNSSNYDRMVYLTTSGTLVFGVSNGGQQTISTAKSYNDNNWHYVVASQGAEGMRLYVDGVLAGSNANTAAQAYNGYWRVASDRTWAGSSATNFAGTIDEVAVYPTALSQSQVAAHYSATGGNVTPSAAFSSNCTYKNCTFDASASIDPDGSIASYAWAYGDGGTDTGANPSHSFTDPGTYNVKLTVTDNGGATGTVTHSVTVAAAPAPVPAFTSSCPSVACSFDATGSTSAGTITSYAWDFGDGKTGTGATVNHTFASPGTYTVTLTVTDDLGGVKSTSNVVTIANQAPTSSFRYSCNVLNCSFDGTGSSDPDGTIASYAWDFGDGTSATGASPKHSYASTGRYTVKLTVTDDLGATNTSQQVLAPANQDPSAAFSSNCTALACSFDGTSSTDPDGTVDSYSWSFGDGTATGPTPSHTLGAAGDYPVTLTVTDNLGATNAVTKTVTVQPAANPNTAPFAVDTFNRTTTSGWGSADTGGAWTATGNAANISVNGGVGKLTMAKATAAPGAYLGGVSATDTDVLTTIAFDKVADGAGVYAYVTGRRVTTNTEYRALVRVLSTGAVTVGLTKLDGSATATTVQAESTVPGLTYTANAALNIRFEVSGTNPTTLRLRVWLAGTAEPASWQITKTDSTASLQAAGGVGISTYLTGSATVIPVTASVTAFKAEPTHTPPNAVAAVNCSGLTCTGDGTASSDTQQDIASYTWSWGDGAITTGSTSNHSYAAAGTYRVTLTVTDASGLTSITRITRIVTTA